MPRRSPKPQTTFFIDSDLAGHGFLRTLEKAGIDFISIHDALPRGSKEQSVKDPEWISLCGKEGWVAITRDHRLRKSWQDEIFQAKARVIILRGSPHSALAENLVASIRQIERYLKRANGPFIAKLFLPTKRDRDRKLKPRGRLETWMSLEQWLVQKGLNSRR